VTGVRIPAGKTTHPDWLWSPQSFLQNLLLAVYPELDMSTKASEMEHLSLYRGSVRGTWREGSHTEDSERQIANRSLWKRTISFYRGSIRGT
jgi:hypothetical protein